jgi:hypothetical protein
MIMTHRLLKDSLILRSRAKRGVSKDGHQARCSCPSFETLAALAPHDEAVREAAA